MQRCVVLVARYLLSCVDYSPLASTPVVEEAIIEVKPIERKEVSKEVIKQIEVFAKGGGKTSKPDINVFIEALKLCGFSVEYGKNWNLKLFSEKDGYVSLPYSYDVSKAFSEAYNAGNKLFFDTDYSNNTAILLLARDLQYFFDNKLVCFFFDSDHVAGTLEISGKGEIEQGQKLQSVLVNMPQLILPTLIITAPNGKSFEAKSRSDYIFACPTAWKFLYENKLDEAAKAVLAQGFEKPLSDEEVLELSRSGLCPICLRYIERREDGAIMRHGWRSRQYTQLQPPCFGWGKPPWEKSPNGAVQYLEHLVKEYIPSIKKELKDILETPPESYINYEARNYTPQQREKFKIKTSWVRNSEDHDKWEKNYKAHINELKYEIAYAESLIPVLKKRIAEWKEQPFWFEANAERVVHAKHNIRVGKGGRI